MQDPNLQSPSAPVKFSDYRQPRSQQQLQTDLNQLWDRIRKERKDFATQIAELNRRLGKERLKSRVLQAILGVLIWKGAEVLFLSLAQLMRK